MDQNEQFEHSEPTGRLKLFLSRCGYVALTAVSLVLIYLQFDRIYGVEKLAGQIGYVISTAIGLFVVGAYLWVFVKMFGPLFRLLLFVLGGLIILYYMGLH
ncbi:hypothetical protein GCM10019059_39130 [Camelimonas fluminis]|uniref:Uncharacterized protein n=1 Tax=Camelimonas fluminis TaxID=1576911 RepID=A0ABV7UI23_9HYPH|nr:hypothetical protein [Camelimonas fluminis]GHE75955.1 hypothetical protein GCM10019059_39130 [Camelimonas fluminis]